MHLDENSWEKPTYSTRLFNNYQTARYYNYSRDAAVLQALTSFANEILRT